MTLLPSCIAENQPEPSGITSQLVGNWIAGETMMPQPPKEMWQNIKTISFQANGIVHWSYVKEGRLEKGIGRYKMWIPGKKLLNQPSIVVAPTNYPNPLLCGRCLLSLEDVSIDIDSRFHPEKVGKVLKAKTKDGKRVVFVRIKKELPTAKSTISSECAPSDEK